MKATWLLLALFSTNVWSSPFDRPARNADGMKTIALYAIQAGGRTKPFDSFAREGLELLTGGESFHGKSAVELTLSIVFEPQLWEELEFIQVNHLKLKRDLGFIETQKYYSPKQLSGSAQLNSLFTELDAKQKAQVKLDPYWQAVQRLGNQLNYLHELVSGRALRFVPPTPEVFATTSDAWLGLDKLQEEMKLRFTLVAATFVSEDAEVHKRFPEHAKTFRDLAKSINPALYPSDAILKSEVTLNTTHPFRWAFVLAVLAALGYSLSFWFAEKPLVYAGASAYGLSLALQLYGFATRCWIAGRPPVSNMYESVIWVSFGAMMFGAFFELRYRKRISAIGASLFGSLGLLVADNVGMVMSAGISPLEPVLRSNLWLSIHVLTITLSYAAFAVALMIGNIGLGQYVIWGRESPAMNTKTLALFCYRTVQVGVVLLAAGTILGGVWADYSWGRFWGWDPKETWALIALLGYLALLHARFRGMVGPFGFLVGCVMAFMGVVMAWYGVNFVLGAGLHSYGFGAGGTAYVATYVCAQIFFASYAAYFYRRRSANV